MKQEQNTPSDLVLAITIGFLACLVLAYIALLFVDRQITYGITYKEVDLAAWIQAIGSISAIFAALLLGHNQAKADRKLELFRRSSEDVRRLQVLDTVLGCLERQCLEAQKALLEHTIPLGPHGLYLRVAIRAVRAIDLFNCPSTRAIELLVLMSTQLERIETGIQAYDSSFDEQYGDSSRENRSLWNGIGVAHSMVEAARKECFDAITRHDIAYEKQSLFAKTK
ncbi:hypothetical protein [Mitsuaria sp. GD03876]|uniref:hypothetical protein n=1 Tax=Mitsuaria sp. GD03876 TaxID=2975399 RepID=UPI0024487FD0|nr:hypothetical protein [Mitsuaria sp. GD03876]MDH0864653.1 hypothetical protein [Mitsuaria sp. GD03876]